MLLFLMVTLTACSGGGEPTTQELSNGALAFQAVWPQPARDVAESTENTPDVCTTFGIETITASVVDADGTERGTGNWPCDTRDHRGTIDGLPVGAGYRVVVQGLIGSDEAWHGNATNVTINAGQTTTIEKIVMHSLDFVLGASSSDGGRIEPAGDIRASAISVQTFTFIPRSNYEVDDVIVDGTSLGFMDTYTFSDIDADHTIYVSFTPTDTTTTTHTITASAGAGGAIVPEGQVEIVQGNDQAFTFQPATGNHISDVFVNGVSQGAIPSYTFNQVTEAHTIRVAFDTTTYTITASAGTGGSIDPQGPVSVAHGSSQSFSITASEGFYLASLRVGGAQVQPQSNYTFPSVTDNATIEADFKPVRYVDADATAGGDGTTWQSAFRNLPDAITAAADGDEIWIRAGTYLLDGPDDQVSVDKTVAIYGGHDGAELFARERDWQANPTIFDGQDRTRAFVVTADARMEGLIIQNTKAPGLENLLGGAMFIDHCAPNLANCAFFGNAFGVRGSRGGAIYADSSSPTFQNCRFEGNSVVDQYAGGGAMYLLDSNTIIDDCVFKNNSASGRYEINGGAIDIRNGTVAITGSNFTSNSAVVADTTHGGAISSHGADLTISRCQFIENKLDGWNYSHGAAIYLNGEYASQEPMIRNTIFVDNTIGIDRWPNHVDGGALSIFNAAPSIMNCTFSGNLAKGYSRSQGGAIANFSSNPVISNTILWGNRAIRNTIPDIIDGEGMQVYDDDASSSTTSFCVIEGSVPNGTDNLHQDPTVDALGHLRPGSIAIDEGDDAAAPAMDVDGESRPQNGRSDIGADEFVDDDADRMPDYWERHHGLDTTTDDGNEDPEGDGLPNLIEYQLGLDPTKANPTVAAVERGWYDDTGLHDAADDRTRCGSGCGSLCGNESGYNYRSYFTFDLPTVSGTVAGAVLRLEVAHYESAQVTETFSVHDVTTDPATLEASASDQSAIYDDLGDGATYADWVSVSPADVDKIIGFALSAAAVTDIEASLGGLFSIGIRPTSANERDFDIYTFSQGSETRTHQLVLIVE